MVPRRLDHDRRGQRPSTPLSLLHTGEGDSPDDATLPGSDGAPTTGTAPLRILVVEDEAIIAFELEDILERLGAEVVGTAMSADDAVRRAEALRPDCVTMDISLHGPRDGISAALEIYERFGIRSVFVSAYGDADARARAEPARPLGWVAKPIRAAQLDSILGTLRDDS